jgi:hypothetical protein
LKGLSAKKAVNFNPHLKTFYKGFRVASSAGISPEESGGGKNLFFSKPIRRLKPIERPAEEAKFRVEFYIKIKPIESKIIPTLYILEIDNSVLKSVQVPFFSVLYKKNNNRVAMATYSVPWLT